MSNQPINGSAKFGVGALVATPAALDALARNGQHPMEFLAKHQRGEWGELSDSDKRANEQALKDGSRILSAYRLKDGTRIWVMTEAVGDNGERASTCTMLPEDY